MVHISLAHPGPAAGWEQIGDGPYMHPSLFDLQIVASLGVYEDPTGHDSHWLVVWRRPADGVLLWDADTGAYGKVPFEHKGVADLKVTLDGTDADFTAALDALSARRPAVVNREWLLNLLGELANLDPHAQSTLSALCDFGGPCRCITPDMIAQARSWG